MTIALTKYLTLDRVIPLAKGGQHSWNNVVTCGQCNQRQSNCTPFHPIVFAEFLREQQVHLEEETGQC